MSLLSFTRKITRRKSAGAKSKKASATKATTKAATKVEMKVDALAGATGQLGLIPVITEKAVSSHSASSMVVFKVRPGVSKGQIATAIKARYKVTPRSIRTMQMAPKRRVRGRTVGATNSWKKAYVTLREGQTIDLSI